jgi:hypothetical protein
MILLNNVRKPFDIPCGDRTPLINSLYLHPHLYPIMDIMAKMYRPPVMLKTGRPSGKKQCLP